MPSFEIPDGPATIPMKAGSGPSDPSSGSAVYGVTNKSTGGLTGRLSVQVADGAKAEWFAIDGEKERAFAAGESQTVNVSIKAPAGTKPGDYKFRLRVVAVNDPDNDHMESPISTLTVPAVGAPPPPKFPWWIVVVGAVVLIAIVVALIVILGPKHHDGRENTTETNTTGNNTTATNTTTVAQIEVPDPGVDKTYDFASGVMANAKLTVAPAIKGAAGGKPPGTVVKIDPAPGTMTTADKPVKLTVDPGVPMPHFVGADKATALTRASDAGIFVDFSVNTCGPFGAPEQVTAQPQADGAPVAKFSRQTLNYQTPRASPLTPCRRFVLTFESAKALNGAVANVVVRDHRQ